MTIKGMKPARLLSGAAIVGAILLLANCPNPVLDQINARAAAATSSVSPFASFSFTSALNTKAGISLDVKGTMNGADVSITVPYGTTLTALVATFATSTQGIVTVGTATQTSASTPNDFSKPVMYTLTAGDGTIYTGTVTAIMGPAGIVIGASTMKLAAGGSPAPLLYTISPSDPSATFTWTTSDPTIVKLTSVGMIPSFGGGAQQGGSPSLIWEELITPLATGTVTVTVKTADGSKSATCVVTVSSPVYVTGLTLNTSSTTIPLGGSPAYIQATVTPSNATNQFVQWSSSTPAVATVDAGGSVTAVSLGYTVITATSLDGNKTATCLVTVSPAVSVSGISVSPSSGTMAVGQTYTMNLNASFTPSNATNQNVTWSSNNTAVATVTNYGGTYAYVTAVSAGPATITATSADGGFTATSAITVTSPVAVSSVSISPAVLSMSVGSSYYLNDYTAPSNATNQGVTWSSSNLSVVSFNYSYSGYANIQAVGAGTATITVTTADGGKISTCAVTVAPAILVNSITFLPATIGVNQSYSFYATVGPNNATNDTLSWSSGSPTKVSASSTYNNGSSGTLTGLAVGTSVVTASSTDGGSKSGNATITVSLVGTTTVTPGIAVLSLAASRDTTVGVGFTTVFTNSTTVPVVWSSDNPSVATATPFTTYNNTGYVYAYNTGTAHIRATPTDGSPASALVTITVNP